MRRPSGRLGLISLLVPLLALFTSLPADAAVARVSRPVERAPATRQTFAVDLYKNGDFVAQTNLIQCVGASMQMMLNIIGPGTDRTASTQRRLFLLARSFHDPFLIGSTARETTARKGASARGWAMGLTELGAGPYKLASAPTIAESLALAARAMRSTGKPVGLLVWQGRHAWVMSGFEATADPARDPSTDVLGVRVLDPLYPRGSSIWGPSPNPNALLSVAELARSFVPWRPHSRNTALRNRYVLVLPYVATPVPTAFRPL